MPSRSLSCHYVTVIRITCLAYTIRMELSFSRLKFDVGSWYEFAVTFPWPAGRPRRLSLNRESQSRDHLRRETDSLPRMITYVSMNAINLPLPCETPLQFRSYASSSCQHNFSGFRLLISRKEKQTDWGLSISAEV